MSAGAGGYGFRPMAADYLPLARRWLRTPEVRRWWGDPDEQLSLPAEDLDEPRMRMWIVSHHGRPFAYIQDYDPLSWDLHHFGDLPPGSRGIDQFIGEPGMLDRGTARPSSAPMPTACSGPAAPQSAPTPTRRTPAPSAPTRRRASGSCAKPWIGKGSRPC